jgi:phage terminase large subunit GpA-like protein
VTPPGEAIVSVEEHDDNAAIMDALKARLELGLKNYGHGVQIFTDKYNWMKMAEEEVLDGLIYATAALLRRETNEAQIEDAFDHYDEEYKLLVLRHEKLVDRCDDLIAFILSNHDQNELPEEVYNAISDHVNEGKPE